MASVNKSVFSFILLCFCVGCYESEISDKRLFQAHVLSELFGSVSNIMFYKDDAAMHGPLFFRFKADLGYYDRIISFHKLKEGVSPKIIDWVYLGATKKVSWLPDIEPSKASRHYSVFYCSNDSKGDVHFRYLMIDDDKAYFITSGRFVVGDYYPKYNSSHCEDK